MQKSPRISFGKKAFTLFIAVETALFAGSYLVYHRMNTSRGKLLAPLYFPKTAECSSFSAVSRLPDSFRMVMCGAVCLVHAFCFFPKLLNFLKKKISYRVIEYQLAMASLSRQFLLKKKLTFEKIFSFMNFYYS